MDKEQLPDLHFGEASDEPEAQELPELEDEADDDDELPHTPPEIIAVLGFDPLDDEDE